MSFISKVKICPGEYLESEASMVKYSTEVDRAIARDQYSKIDIFFRLDIRLDIFSYCPNDWGQ